MISIVFSTRKDNPDYINHINKTIGVRDYEIIQIVNEGKYSLTEAYNKGLKDSNNDIVAFIHDDLILPEKWGKKMLNHFNESDYGILGVAGTTDLPESGMWWQDNTKMIGIVKHSHNGKTWENKYSASFGTEIIQSVVVDGLFFVVDKNRIKKDFNEDIKGFHLYDIDFTFNNHINDVKVGVVFDVRVIHKSIGQTNQQWEDNRKQFVEIYKEHLPYNLNPEIRFENKVVKLKTTPKVSVVIPTKGNIDLLSQCVTSIIEKDDYPNIEVLIADTGSEEEEKDEIKKLIESYTDKTKIRLIEYDYYNFAKINNDVVRNYVSDDTELILFSNNDIKVLNNAISQMVEVYLKNKKSVGTIGARLHFEDNTIQHGGIITFLGQNNNGKYSVGLSHHGIKSYYNYSTNKKEVLGNTAAFLMISKNLFKKINGFREIYKECFEDVHLNIDCLRMGKKNIFIGDAVCYHYESITRNGDSMRLERESEDYSKRIIPYIKDNEVTYKYFTNVKENILKQIFSNAKATN